MFGAHMVLLAVQKPGQKNIFSVCRPNTGDSYFDLDRAELEAKYVKVSEEEAKEEWQAAYESSLAVCMHGGGCAHGAACQVGGARCCWWPCCVPAALGWQRPR